MFELMAGILLFLIMAIFIILTLIAITFLIHFLGKLLAELVGDCSEWFKSSLERRI